MSESIVPMEQVEVAFGHDHVLAVTASGGDGEAVYVPIRPICDSLGLSWPGQRERIQRDPVLSDLVRGVRVTRPPEDGGTQTLSALPLSHLNGWLFGISVARVKPEIRETILRYQRECYGVLYAYFKAKARGRIEVSSLADVKAVGAALIQLGEAQEQLQDQVDAHTEVLAEAARMVGELLQGLDKAHDRLDGAGRYISGISRRLAGVEKVIDPSEPLTPAMKNKIKSLVDECAYLLGRTPGYAHSGRRKPYPAVWSKMHRLAVVNSYEEIRQRHYDGLVRELNDWIERMREWEAANG